MPDSSRSACPRPPAERGQNVTAGNGPDVGPGELVVPYDSMTPVMVPTAPGSSVPMTHSPSKTPVSTETAETFPARVEGHLD